MNYEAEHQFIYNLCETLLQKYPTGHIAQDVTSSKLNEYDVVTAIDEEINQFLSAAIAAEYKDDEILAEETANTKTITTTKRCWAIDPICGTTNLSKGLPFYVTNIALVENQKVVAAWVVNYPQNAILSSIGDGLAVNNQPFTPAPYTGRILLDIDEGNAEHFGEAGKRYFELRTTVSQDSRYGLRTTASSICFAMVATGNLQGVTVFGTNPWDVLAAAFLVTQSGGVSLNFDGEPYSIHDTNFIFAQDDALAQELLALIKTKNLT